MDRGGLVCDENRYKGKVWYSPYTSFPSGMLFCYCLKLESWEQKRKLNGPTLFDSTSM